MGSAYPKIRLVGLCLLLVLAFLLDVSLGSVKIPLRDVLNTLFSSSHGSDTTWVFIIKQIRLPKACTAVLAGCSLSVSGLQMQTLFRNPLADPAVLGITAGASFGVALVMLSSGNMATLDAIREVGLSGSWLLIAVACMGAGIVMALVLVLSGRLRDNVLMLVIGMMIASLTMAIIGIWQYFSSPEQIKEYLLWTFGSLGGVTDSQLISLSVVTLAGLTMAWLSSKMLDALQLGENYARSMGLNPKRARLVIICSSSLLSGSITAFCGPIGFIGIAVPHITRQLFRSASHRVLVPACCLIGTLLLLFCDVISQLPSSQAVLPINIITALIGAPVVVALLLRQKNVNVY
ncbi:MAG: iron ABC transporter permease [Bacteroidetes bacterium]|nr:iron ABC transporter permease [Bacteroidota bacterium]